MSKDKLKNIIENERSSFEVEEPREGLWNEIRAELHDEDPQVEGLPRRKVWSIAASIAVIIGLGSMFYLSDKKGGDNPEYVNRMEASAFDLSRFGEELMEVDRFYSVQVGHKMKKLSAYDVDEEYLDEMEFLNEEFEELKMEMGQGMDDAKVVEALIENYRLRLSLLEDLLQAVESNDDNPQKNEEHEV